MNKYKTTIKTWDKIATLYQEKFMDLKIYNDSYDSFCKFINNKNAKVLEIGCGPGNITKYLKAKHSDYKIKATDVAPSMIALAKENNPTLDFEVLDAREIGKLNEKFDGIICGFCLPYISKKDCAKLISDNSQLLHEKGVFYLSTIEGDYNNSGYEYGSTGDKTYVYYYSESFLINELKVNNFNLLEVLKIKYPKSENTFQTHMILIAKKN